MKSILITNLYFEGYTGSELHVLEMARMFQKKGYEVTIAVFRKAYPLLNEAKGIHVIECGRDKLNKTKYDILFVQHFPVFDYLCTHYDLTYRYLIVSKLGPANIYETLSPCVDWADMIVTVSQECADAIYDQIGKDDRVFIFQNCLENEYFIENNKQLKLEKVAIISNHITDEVLALKELLPSISFDLIGKEGTPKRVSPELLQEYDLIITIGRTVPAAFACHVPVYVYDYMGGPGYLNDENYELAEKNNFSGRGFFKRDANELAKDIKLGYEANLQRLEWLYNKACEKHNYRKQFEKLYDSLTAEDREYKAMNLYTGIEKECKKWYSFLNYSEMCLPLKHNSYFYYDVGAGFTDENSVNWPAIEEHPVSYTVTIDKGMCRLRFDPCSAMCTCEILSVVCNGVSYEKCMRPLNAVKTGAEDLFMTTDPQYCLTISPEMEGKELFIEYKYKMLSEAEVVEQYTELLDEKEQRIRNQENIIRQQKEDLSAIQEKLQETKNELMKRTEDLRQVTESTIWRKSEPIRRVLDKIKK